MAGFVYSEVTLFYSRDYYRSFYGDRHASHRDRWRRTMDYNCHLAGWSVVLM
ncbi:DUF3916 domain-containing protein [Synechococcus elongatus IITB5]